MSRFVLSIFCILMSAAQLRADQPNFLFIFADDQCFQTINELGNKEIETPNLDTLARSGVTFSHTYNMGGWNGAICVASRTMLNTGRFIWNANEVHPHLANEVAEDRFWAKILSNAGYETYFSGKWHVGKNTVCEAAFDHARHIRPGMPNQTPAGYNRPFKDKPDAWSPFDKSFDGFWKGGKHWSEVLADDAVDYLDQSSQRNKPFFMYLAFNAPHDPRQAPKEYVDKYPLDKIAVPKSFLPEYPYKDDIGCSAKLRDEKLAPFPRTEYAVKVHRQEYYAIITHMDAQIGRILEALDKTGKRDNTYIIFTADHGLAVGHHGLIGKQNQYDHSIRVPFMMCGPDLKPGKTVDTSIYLQDVVPTTLELANIEKPEHVDFNSLVPLLRGQSEKHTYDAIYGAYMMLQRSVTFEDFKLIVYPKANKVRLYDLKNDPLEQKDLADDAKFQDTKQRLIDRLLNLQAEMHDPLNLRPMLSGLEKAA